MLYKILLFNIISCCAVCGVAFCDCTQLGESNNGCAAGTYWANGNCNNVCPAGHYCPYGGVAYCCPEPFTETVITDNSGNIIGYTGAKSAKYCFIKISECGTTPLSTPIYIGCKDDKWEHQNTGYARCNEPGQDYEVQKSLNNDHNCSYNKRAHYWHNIIDENGTLTPLDGFAVIDILDNTDPDSNHLETVPLYGDCPRVDNQAWFETSFELKCVPNTIDCSFLAEHINDDIAATSNIQTCGNGTVTGRAHWISPDNPENNLQQNGLKIGHWDISECDCLFSGELNEDAHCYGDGTYDAIFNNTYVENIDTVHTIGEHIIFNPESNSSDFICTKCQEGPYYVYGNDNIVTVTECKEATTYGTWRKPKNSGYCNDDENSGSSWTYPLNGNPCKLQNCGAGKTTTTLAPIGSGNCQYSSQTKFCDANGCFQIDAGDFSNWTF